MQIGLGLQTRSRPMPLTSSVVQQTMARFRTFYSLQKVKLVCLEQVQRFI